MVSVHGLADHPVTVSFCMLVEYASFIADHCCVPTERMDFPHGHLQNVECTLDLATATFTSAQASSTSFDNVAVNDVLWMCKV